MEEPVRILDNPVKISEWFSHYRVGNRIRLTNQQTNQLTNYIVDPNRTLPSIIAETNSSGTITAYYVYGLGLISKIAGTSAYFYQYDGLGSTVAMTDKTGAIKNTYAYDDFGNVATNSTETIANPFKYVGRFGVTTDLNDLLYMRARYYMPSVGRFLNKDPIGLAGGLNLYGYVGGNPIRFIDPSGLGGAGGSWCSRESWWKPTPGRISRWVGRILQEAGYKVAGKTISIAGLVLEPGGTGKITGIILGGAAGAKFGAGLGTYILPGWGTFIGGAAGGIGGGIIGGSVGEWFDSTDAGYVY